MRTQHTRPCGDCPFRRGSLKGWLGGHAPQEFMVFAMADGAYPCHTRAGALGVSLIQCAGMAIFRANIGKLPRGRRALRLPQDKALVFGTPGEFLEHHSR